jgi:hypothetical protein
LVAGIYAAAASAAVVFAARICIVRVVSDGTAPADSAFHAT